MAVAADERGRPAVEVGHPTRDVKRHPEPHQRRDLDRLRHDGLGAAEIRWERVGAELSERERKSRATRKSRSGHSGSPFAICAGLSQQSC